MAGRRLKDIHKGIICILISASSFAVMNMLVRLSGDVPSLQKSFFRNAVAAVFALVIILKERHETSIDRKNIPLLILRSLLGTVGVVCNFYAVDHLMLSDATMLNKLSPFFTLICSAIFLKEKVSLKEILIVIDAFTGSLFIIKPSFSNADFAVSLIGLLGGLGAGSAYACVRALGKRGEKGPVIVLFFSAFSCLATLPSILFFYSPMTVAQTGLLLLAGLFAAFGQFAITAAYSFAPARKISVYDYSQVIFSALLGYIAFAQIPDYLSFIGYFIIILMAVLMFLLQKSLENKMGNQ